METHLLIDGKNVLYRAVYVKAYSKIPNGNHTSNIVLSFLFDYLNKFHPTQIHVFWDSPRSQTWRKQIYPEYKEGRSGTDKISTEDVKKNVNELMEVCMLLFQNMGIKQYYRAGQEADDLIYTFCKMNTKDNIIIISSDKDLLQIIYRFSNVKLHSHLSKHDGLYEPIPTYDPIISKCLSGDKSDNINGYYKVGPVTAKTLSEDIYARNDFFKSDRARARVGDEIVTIGLDKFKENMRLVDLSMNPHLLDNVLYILERQCQKTSFNLKMVRQIILKYKIRGLTANIATYVAPFKKFADNG